MIVTKARPLDNSGPEIVYVNKAFTELTEYTFEEAVGKTPRMLQSDKSDSEPLNTIRAALVDNKPVRVVVSIRSKSGRDYWLDISMLPLYDDQGEVTHFVAIERDVTEQIKQEERLASEARTDSLTGLLNGRTFDEELAAEFSRFQRRRSKYSVLMLDIDDFNELNDTYGQDFGDIVLRSLAQCCKDSIRLHDTLARIGGKEFSIISPHNSQKAAQKMAEKLRQRIEELAFEFDGQNLKITVCIGVSEVDFEDYDHTSVLERADEALRETKARGPNTICGQ